MYCFIEYILLILGFFKHSVRKGCFIGWVNEDGGKSYAARDTVFSESERKERSNSNSSRQSSSLILNF